ncbi:hypothetical protein [Blastopirellula marina]|uniref:Circumsporozoite protein-putative membrane associated protein n=1 Tax=Blastopirellula marina TaxID=124 RepID=A0A2S8GEK8_9BACT|nr:hypothetical protein [Blastopirellula marina]PQO42750.1 hypothetical protein C5Y98_00940 [Blastopirellula marina]PTL46516.1 hypothetical protein C5Y97_00940 [Blastopirellula marina]
MSTDAPSTLTSAESRPVNSAGQDFIRRKINSTRRSVKLAELAAGLLLFGAGSLLFLLTLAIVDHWIIGLGFWARLAAFFVYVGAAVAFLWIYVVPLLVHSINPLYAARIIEQGQPTLKNSLLNFLFLSQNQQGTRKAVLDAIETQAASDVSSLKLEHLVDYTKAIRIGYVLAALAVLFGLYKVLSPKDPLQTAARVLLPWQEIARPSRVKIEDVKPGSTSIYQGESLEITAKIYDVGSSDELKVVYSTKDGQLVDQSIPLEAANDGFTFRALLKTSDAGIQQDLTYRLEAGDAVTSDYEVMTLEAPSIDITSLRYDFPAYTREPWREQEGDGHIRALEGTMVTLRAVANRPIQKAYIEFDPIEGGPVVTLNTIPMRVDAESPKNATVRFPLELNEAGTAGKFRSYQVRFRTEDGVMNPHPVLYHIDVQRDLPPEIEWVEPRASEVEVPLNQSLATKLRAIDPDFGVRQIRVVATKEGQPLFDEAILREPKSGQAVEAWSLVPAKYGLQEGQVVKLIGIAEDTRTDFEGSLKPNRAETRPRTIRIVAPVQGAKSNDPNQDQPNEDNPQGEKNPEQQAGNSGEKSGDPNNQDQPGDKGDMQEQDPKSEGGEESKGEEGSQGKSGQDGMKGQNDQPQEGENDSQNQEDSGKGSTGSAKPQEGEQPPQDQQQPGENSDPQEGSQAGDSQDGQQQQGEGGASGSQQQQDGQNSDSKGSGGQGGKASSSSDQQNRDQNQSNQAGNPSGKGSGKPGDPNNQGKLQKGDSSTQPNENSTVERKPDPVASDGSQDGDAFERLQEYLNEKQQQQNAGGKQPSPEKGDPQDASQQNKPQTSGGEATGEQRPSDSSDPENAGKGSANQNQGNPDQKNQGSGNMESQEGSTGQQEGMKPDGSGVDNAAKPEKSAGGENATDQEKQDGQPGTTDNNKGEATERNTQNNEQGAGQNKGGAVNKDTDAKSSNESERPGDKGVGDSGDSGAGNEGNEGDTGSPESSADQSNKQRQNDTHSEDGKKGEQGETPKSPSNSNKQSQSKGDQQGDQSGGGGAGGGQPAKQAGNDSPGSTSAADEGAGVANQQGKGETGEEGGNGPQADQQTGSSGNQQGEGSQTTKSASGEKPGENGASSDEDTPQDSQQQKSDPNQSGRGPGNSAIPQGGGRESGNSAPTYDGPRVEPGEDAANLEYAKKATDMVLDKLEHQKGSPDQEMLDELGWSKEDFQRFMERWKKMKQAADSSDTGAKRELNEALRSLGLSRGNDTTRRVQARSATSGGSADTQRTAPPPAFLEQYRAYLKGASQ